MNVKMKKLISITPERLLVRIKKFDITDEQRDYLLSTQAMMQIKFNSNVHANDWANTEVIGSRLAIKRSPRAWDLSVCLYVPGTLGDYEGRFNCC